MNELLMELLKRYSDPATQPDGDQSLRDLMGSLASQEARSGHIQNDLQRQRMLMDRPLGSDTITSHTGQSIELAPTGIELLLGMYSRNKARKRVEKLRQEQLMNSESNMMNQVELLKKVFGESRAQPQPQARPYGSLGNGMFGA